MKTNLKRKLSSRKFWVMVTGFVTPLLLAFGLSDSAVVHIAGILAAAADVVTYMLVEGCIDIKHAEKGGSHG